MSNRILKRKREEIENLDDFQNKKKLPNSFDGPKPELDLFVVPSTNTSVEEGCWGEYLPLVITNTGPLEFRVSSSESGYIDLSRTCLYLSVKIINKTTNQVIDSKDVVAPTNNFLHSLFSQIDVDFNGTNFETSNNTYAYKAYLTDLLNYGEDSKSTLLQSSLFYKDTAFHMNETKIPAVKIEASSSADVSKTKQDTTVKTEENLNEGFVKRRDVLIKGNGTLDMIGKIHCDIFNSNRYLLNNVSMFIRFTRAKDNFCLISDKDDYVVHIEKARLLIRRVQISPSVQTGHDMALARTNAKYPIKRVIVKSFLITKGIKDETITNINTNVLPNRIVIGMVDNQAFNGAIKRNPFNFHHYNLSSIGVLVDGKNSVYGQPIEFDFKNRKFIRGYYSLFENIDKPVFATGNGISRSDYDGGYTLLAFDLTPDLSSGEQFNLIKNGNLSIALKFDEAVPDPLTLIVYMEYDNMIEISSSRQVTLDYQV